MEAKNIMDALSLLYDLRAFAHNRSDVAWKKLYRASSHLDAQLAELMQEAA